MDSEHKVGDSYCEVIQIDEYQPPKSVNKPPSVGTVPLARAVGDLTVQFQEQVNELALTYGMSPITLSQAAVNHICGRGDGVKGPAASTPVSARKTQPFSNLQPVYSSNVNSPSSGTQAPSGALLINPLPADVQNVIMEHDSTMHFPPTRELRLFSGISPKPSVEVDYSIWRLRATQVINDSSLSEVQQRRALLDSLLTPALNIALSIGAQATPSAYLQALDRAYGSVIGGEELYIQFLETHQNTGEKASDYLRRLHALLQEAVENNGVAKQDADSQLLKQFLRGCWDDSLITTLHLKEPFNDPTKGVPTFSESLFRIRAYEKESQLKEMRKQRHMGGNVTKVHTKAHLSQSEPEFISSVSIGQDARSREQLEDRVRQLEAELQKSTLPQNNHSSRSERVGRKFPKRNISTPVASVTPTESPRKVGKFCYNCGEDLHMLPQSTNPTNAVLVQKKLCERHQNRQNPCLIFPQQNNPDRNLSLNR